MRAHFPRYRKTLQFTALLLTLHLLYACGGSPTRNTSAANTTQAKTSVEDASIQLPDSQFADLFQQAELQLTAFDWLGASATLAQLPSDEPDPAEQSPVNGPSLTELPAESTGQETAVEELTPQDREYLAYLQARISYTRGDQNSAAQQLTGLQQRSLHPAFASKVDTLQHHLLRTSGQSLQSAHLGSQMLQHGGQTQDRHESLVRDTWHDLQKLPKETLAKALASASDPDWREWLTLALMSAQASSEPELKTNLTDWLAQNPQGTAPGQLPGGLDYLLEDHPPLTNVALLLPLSGRLAPAAKAIRDGYLANYYQARSRGGAQHSIQVIDLDRYSSAIEAYDEAVATGTNLVIGPLSKKDVVALGSHPIRPTPVIALNRVDQPFPVGNTALIQLSLAPEDEALQIAEMAFGQGNRRAFVIRPAGQWGTKMERALTTRWQQLGGQIDSVASYSSQEDYSSSMEQALNLEQSKKRARDLRSMLATNIEFTARRRQDIDVVFLLSHSSAEARSLKPLLAYHYASDLPVFSTSAIYQGSRDSRDKDLNGTRLLETPWLLGHNQPLQAALSAENIGSESYTRLNALGADAYLLQTRFRQLQAGPDVRIRGNTGLLGLDPQLRIRRELQPAAFDGGVLRAR